MATLQKRAIATRATTPSSEQAHPESLLWAYRLRSEHRKTDQRITDNNSTLKAAIYDNDVQISNLQDDFRGLSTSVSLLQSHENTLHHRLGDLEHQLNEKNQSASSPEVSDHLQTLADDQEYGLRTLGQHFIFLRNETQAELANLRAEVSRLTAARVLNEQKARNNSPVDSEATTVDTSQVLDISRPMHSHAASAHDVEERGPQLRLPEQGLQSLEQYLTVGGTTIADRLKSYEDELCKSFVAGLKEEGYRAVLQTRLQQIGWTWANLLKEIGPLLDGGDRRLKNGKRRRVR